MSQETVIDGVDYGPLASLVGTWKGDKGMDVAPEPDGKEENPYYETIFFEAIGDLTNAEEQVLTALRYHQVVNRKSNDQVFHNETGYFMWDAGTGTVSQTLTIPRGVCLVAGGKSSKDATSFEVKAGLEDKDWGIVQPPFMRDKARTTAFRRKIAVEDNKLTYFQTIMLEIYGKTFEHTDENTLTRSS